MTKCLYKLNKSVEKMQKTKVCAQLIILNILSLNWVNITKICYQKNFFAKHQRENVHNSISQLFTSNNEYHNYNNSNYTCTYS